MLVAFILSACGLKGPLYLPEDNSSTQSQDVIRNS
ncbi:MAG: lipoprotein [Gammaproteobacteria bacterium]|nr:lipoprotein [Gammaproteobacteria bacterium]